MNNTLQKLISILEKDERLVVDGELLKNKIIELANKNDKALLKLLKENELIRKHFFVEVDNILVFDKNKFIDFVNNKNFLADSYTKYKNSIGLSVGDRYFKENEDVVLAWPYKDCVLEGGQTKEDAKRDEVFHNETLAPDQIDRLLDPKVFTNFKNYTKDGEKELTGDEDINFENENLIIKGNNLIALHSLKKKYAGGVKLIYIDPPYNTGADTFNYNDRFNHSSWLTFMKNRLLVAKELMKENGVIIIHCDDNEQAYLKILLDELFGEENFLGTLIRKTRSGGGAMSKYIATNHDYAIVFAKNINQLSDFFVSYSEKYLKRYKEKDEKGRFFWDTFVRRRAGNNNVYTIIAPDGAKLKDKWNLTKDKFEGLYENGDIKFSKNGDSWSVLFKQRINDSGKKLASIIENAKNNRGTSEIMKLFGERMFDYPKPENFIKTILDLTTNENDIVLDYHLGSGTTCAVAHKMNRRYIGVEQMDYIQDITIIRLKKVLNGEIGGISETVNWKGGGSFVYCELAQWNEQYIQEIKKAKTEKELASIYETMRKKSFLSYKVNPKDIDETKKSYNELSFENKKRFLIELLDKNYLYIPYSEIEDKAFDVSEEDKRLNKKFYSK